MKYPETYRFSTETLRYDKIRENIFYKAYRRFPFLVITTIAGIFYTLSVLIKSPGERKLATINKNLQEQLSQLNKKVDAFESSMQQLSVKDDSLYRTILGVSELPAHVRTAGAGGRAHRQTHTERVSEISLRLNHLAAQLKVQDQSFNKLFTKAQQNKKQLLNIPAIMPIDNKNLLHTGSGFGMRFHPILHIWRMHEGIDFYARKGTPVYATAHGTVITQRYSTTFGNLIVIDHGNGIHTHYAHLSEFKIKKGNAVQRGDVIASVGSSGLSSGPHLHYEVHVNGRETDPVHYFFNDLTPKQYEEIKSLAQREMYSMD